MPPTTSLKFPVELKLKNSGSVVHQMNGIWNRVEEQLQAKITKTMKEAGSALYRPKDIRRLQSDMEGIVKKMGRAQASSDNEALAALNMRFRKMLIHEEALISKRKKALEEAAEFEKRTAKEFGESLVSTLREGISSVTNTDIKGMIGVLGEGLKKAGKSLQLKGLNMEKVGGMNPSKMGDTIAKLGTFFAGAGKIVMYLGAFVLGFAAIASAIIGLDSKVKGFNKTIVQSGIAAGDLHANLGRMTESMNDLRNAFASDFAFLTKWGIMSEDAVRVVGSFNKAGLTFRELTRDVDSAAAKMQHLRDSTAVALKYANLLGISGEEAAEKLATKVEELGTTLEGVDARFSGVYDAAMQSGFGVQRFFNMVLQATSGMSLYNYRVEEAASLLIGLGKALGSTKAEALLGDLTKQAQGMGIQDRLKDTLLVGQPTAAKIMRRGVISKGESFVRSALDRFGTGGLDVLKDAFKAQGVDLSMVGREGVMAPGREGVESRKGIGMEIATALSNMEAKDRATLIQRIGEKDEDLARSLSSLAEIAPALKGDVKSLSVARGQAGPIENLLFAMNKSREVFGGKQLFELDQAEQLAALESMGFSPEQIRELQRVGQQFFGQFQLLQEYQKSFISEFGEDFDPEKASPKLKKRFEERQKEMINKFGAFVDESGQIVAGRVTQEGTVEATSGGIADVMEFIQSQGERFNTIAEPLSAQEAAAQTMVANTTDILHYIKVGVEVFLNGIYNVIKEIKSMLGIQWGEGPQESKEIKMKALDMARGRREELSRAESALEAESKRLEYKMKSSKDITERSFLQGRVDQINKQREEVKAGIGVAAEMERNIESMVVTGDLTPGQVTQAAFSDIAKGKGMSETNQEAFFNPLLKDNDTIAQDSKAFSKKQQNLHEKFMKGELPREFAKEYVGALNEAQMMDAFSKVGIEGDVAKGLTAALASGQLPKQIYSGGKLVDVNELLNSTVPGGTKTRLQALMEMPGGVGGALPLLNKAAPVAQDFLLRLNSQTGELTPITAFNPSDNLTVSGYKEGGAVSQSSGANVSGRGPTVHNHFYNDAKGNYRQSKDLYLQMIRGSNRP